MRTTNLILTLLSLASPLLAAPLPDIPHQKVESHDRAFFSHHRALSAISRPSPQHLPAPHSLPINTPHTPSRPTVVHTLPEAPASDSRWALFTPRKPCHDRVGDVVSASEIDDTHLPKEISQHWSETRPAEVTRPGSESEVRRWKIISFRVMNTHITYTSIFRKATFEHVIWVLSALLVLAMGIELISLWNERSEVEEEGNEESGVCECAKERGVDEKEIVMEKGRVINGYWRLEDGDTDVEEDGDEDLDENGMVRSSW